MEVTREEFARGFLPLVHGRLWKPNLYAVVAWMTAENSRARFNPLATTQPMPGATDFNPSHVKNYVSLEQGLEATARTMNWGADHSLYGYKAIRRRLRLGVWARNTLLAVEDSAWGTGGLALDVLPQVKHAWDEYRQLLITT